MPSVKTASAMGEDVAVPHPLSKGQAGSTHWPLCEETGLALPKELPHHLQALTHSLTHSLARHLTSPPARFLQPLPQTKQQPGQTCCLPSATETTEAQTGQLPAKREQKVSTRSRSNKEGVRECMLARARHCKASNFWQRGLCR